MARRSIRKIRHQEKFRESKNVCRNCGEIGSHFVPPCSRDEGFFACQKPIEFAKTLKEIFEEKV